MTGSAASRAALLIAALGSISAAASCDVTAATAGGAATPGEPVASVLTLDEAITNALGHNPGVVAASHAAASAAEGPVQARSLLFPRLEAVEIASRTDNPTMVFSNLLGQAAFTRASFAIPSLNEPDPLNNFSSRLILTQPIYAGGRIEAGRAASEAMADAATGTGRRARQEAIYGTTRAYQGVLLARARIGVADAAWAAAGSHRKMAEDLVAAGVAVPGDVMRVKVRLAEIAEMRIRAVSGEKVARAALEAMMGVRPAGPYDLAEPAGPDPALPDLEEARALALSTRPDLAAARSGASAAGAGVRAASASWKPQAGFTGMYELNDDAFLNSGGRNWTAMVTVGLRLFDGGMTASQVRQGREEEARARSLVAGFESQVVMEVSQARAELEGAIARREAARQAVALAEEALRVARDRYENGLGTVADLLGEETALTDARSREAEARYDGRNGEALLQLAQGILGEKP